MPSFNKSGECAVVTGQTYRSVVCDFKGNKISRKCLGIVYQNIWFALVIKFACLALGALGIANMWLAIFADVGVMVIAVLNAIRALNVKRL